MPTDFYSQWTSALNSPGAQFQYWNTYDALVAAGTAAAR